MDYLCFSYCFCGIIHDSVFIYTVHQCLFYICYYFLSLKNIETIIVHTGKCIRRFAGIYTYCRYFIDRKW